MTDKAYISSMVAVHFAFAQIENSIGAKENSKEKKKRYDFSKRVAGEGVIDKALSGALKAVYYLMEAAGLDPKKVEGELAGLMPKNGTNTMDLTSGKVTYLTNRASRIEAVYKFMEKHELFDEKLISNIENTELRDTIITMYGKREKVKELAAFEKKYVKLRKGFDKADSPFLLIQRYIEGFQKNDSKLKKGGIVKLADGEYIQFKKVGENYYRIIGFVDKSVSYTDENGNTKNVKTKQEITTLEKEIGQKGSIEEEKASVDEPEEAKEELLKTHVEGAEITKEELLKTHVEGAEIYKEEFLKTHVEGAELTKEELLKTHVEGAELYKEELLKNHVEGAELYKEELLKNHVEGAELYKKELPKTEEEESPADKNKAEEEPQAASHFTPSYIRSKLEEIRLTLMTKGVKNESGLKKLQKKAGAEVNSKEWKEFFAQDGTKEYKNMAVALNNLIDALAVAESGKNAENVRTAFSNLKTAADNYRVTHKSVLSVFGIGRHVTSIGDIRMATALQLLSTSSVFGSMMEKYIENGSKDITTVMDAKEKEDETKRLNDVMVARSNYTKHLLKDVLSLSASELQTITACASDTDVFGEKCGSIPGFPKDVKMRAVWYVAVSRLKEIMTGDMTLEAINEKIEKDFKGKELGKDIAKLQSDPVFTSYISQKNASLKGWREVEMAKELYREDSKAIGEVIRKNLKEPKSKSKVKSASNNETNYDMQMAMQQMPEMTKTPTVTMAETSKTAVKKTEFN